MLRDVQPDLRAPLAALLSRGAEVPLVGVDVGEPIVAVAELYFPRAQLVIVPDATDDEFKALHRQGLTALRTLDDDVAALLGLPPEEMA